MTDFPASPLPPAEFFEQWLPQRFAAAELTPALREADLSLGVVLRGEGGGEWLLTIEDGALRVASGGEWLPTIEDGASRVASGGEWLPTIEDGASRVAGGARKGVPVTLVQGVAEWRGGLWEGRGGAFSARVSALFDPVALAAALKDREKLLLRDGPVSHLERVGAHVELRVTGAPGGDWSAGVLLGPGSIERPDARIVLTERDADALIEGRLDVVEALMGGKLQLEGDSGFLLKLPRLFGWLA